MKLRALAGAAIVALVVTVAAACGGSDVATPDDPVLAEGQRVYEANCAACHGKAGGGGGTGPKLAGVVEARLTFEEHVAVIADGRSSTAMPAFKSRLTAEEIEAVARYEREVL